MLTGRVERPKLSMDCLCPWGDFLFLSFPFSFSFSFFLFLFFFFFFFFLAPFFFFFFLLFFFFFLAWKIPASLSTTFWTLQSTSCQGPATAWREDWNSPGCSVYNLGPKVNIFATLASFSLSFLVFVFVFFLHQQSWMQIRLNLLEPWIYWMKEKKNWEKKIK